MEGPPCPQPHLTKHALPPKQQLMMLSGTGKSSGKRAPEKVSETFCVTREDTTFAALLKACANKKDIYKGCRLHAYILKNGLLDDSLYVANALISMYAKCGALGRARNVVRGLPFRDAFTWTALIAGYAQEGHGKDALTCFEHMQQEGLSPDTVTYTCILQACGSIGACEKGEQIHDEITKQGLLKGNIVLGTALVDMYAKCGALKKAQCIFDELDARNVICWNSLIAGYAQKGQGQDALDCLDRMEQDGLLPDAVTYSCLLKACGSLGAADMGEQIHEEIARQGLLGNNIVLGTALLDMYARCGALGKARSVFDELPSRNVVSWSALITGYVIQGQAHDALDCYEQMQRDGISPNKVTFLSILRACGSVGAADKGDQVHKEMARLGLVRRNIAIGTALVDMYAKCGGLTKAQEVLEALSVGDVISWSALISGYAEQGYGEEALSCLEQMESKGFSPDAVTFSSVLNACSNLGLCEEGELFFECMKTRFGIKPDIEHYTCMIHLLGYAGHFDKAVSVIQRMPSSNFSAVWTALLGACRKWDDIKLGRWAFEHAVQVDNSDSAAYVCMARIYAAAGMQEDAKEIEAMRVRNKAHKKQGCGWADNEK